MITQEQTGFPQSVYDAISAGEESNRRLEVLIKDTSCQSTNLGETNASYMTGGGARLITWQNGGNRQDILHAGAITVFGKSNEIDPASWDTGDVNVIPDNTQATPTYLIENQLGNSITRRYVSYDVATNAFSWGASLDTYTIPDRASEGQSFLGYTHLQNDKYLLLYGLDYTGQTGMGFPHVEVEMFVATLSGTTLTIDSGSESLTYPHYFSGFTFEELDDDNILLFAQTYLPGLYGAESYVDEQGEPIQYWEQTVGLVTWVIPKTTENPFFDIKGHYVIDSFGLLNADIETFYSSYFCKDGDTFRVFATIKKGDPERKEGIENGSKYYATYYYSSKNGKDWSLPEYFFSDDGAERMYGFGKNYDGETIMYCQSSAISDNGFVPEYGKAMYRIDTCNIPSFSNAQTYDISSLVIGYQGNYSQFNSSTLEIDITQGLLTDLGLTAVVDILANRPQVIINAIYTVDGQDYILPLFDGVISSKIFNIDGQSKIAQINCVNQASRVGGIVNSPRTYNYNRPANEYPKWLETGELIISTNQDISHFEEDADWQLEDIFFGEKWKYNGVSDLGYKTYEIVHRVLQTNEYHAWGIICLFPSSAYKAKLACYLTTPDESKSSPFGDTETFEYPLHLPGGLHPPRHIYVRYNKLVFVFEGGGKSEHRIKPSTTAEKYSYFGKLYVADYPVTHGNFSFKYTCEIENLFEDAEFSWRMTGLMPFGYDNNGLNGLLSWLAQKANTDVEYKDPIPNENGIYTYHDYGHQINDGTNVFIFDGDYENNYGASFFPDAPELFGDNRDVELLSSSRGEIRLSDGTTVNQFFPYTNTKDKIFFIKIKDHGMQLMMIASDTMYNPTLGSYSNIDWAEPFFYGTNVDKLYPYGSFYLEQFTFKKQVEIDQFFYALLDIGETVQSAISRTIEGRYLKQSSPMLTNGIRIYEPYVSLNSPVATIPSELTIKIGYSTDYEKYVNQIRVLGAYIHGEIQSPTMASKSYPKLKEINNPFLFTQQQCDAEARKWETRILNEATQGVVETLWSPFVEVGDTVTLEALNNVNVEIDGINVKWDKGNFYVSYKFTGSVE